MKSLYILNFAVSYFTIISLFVGTTDSMKTPKIIILKLPNGQLQSISETLKDRNDLLFKNRVSVMPSYNDQYLNNVLKMYKLLLNPDKEYTLSRLLKEHSRTPTEPKVSYTVLKMDNQDLEDDYDTFKIYEDLTLDSSIEQTPLLRVSHKQNKRHEGQRRLKKKLKSINKRNSKAKYLRSYLDGTVEPDVPHIHMLKLLNDDNYEDREQSNEHISLQELPFVLQNLLNDGPTDVQDRNENDGLKQRLKSQRQGLYLLSQTNDNKELLDNNISKGGAYQLLSLLAKNDGKPGNVNENGLYAKTYRLDKDKGSSDDNNLLNALKHGNKNVILLPIKTIMDKVSQTKIDPRHWAAQFDGTLYSNENEEKDLIHFIDSANDTEPKNPHHFEDMTRLDEHTKVLQLLAKKGALPKSLKHLSTNAKPSHKAAPPFFLRAGLGDDRTAPPRKKYKYDDKYTDID